MMKINIHKKIKIFSVLLLILFVSAVIITNARDAIADSVAQVQTTKFFAPETVNMLKQRIAAGGGGSLLKAGDTISYIITFTPVNAGGNIGAGGYITDYIPPNTQVVGAEYVQPDGAGGYTAVSVGQQAYMPAGWGRRGTQSAIYGAPFAGFPDGSLAQVYADTGIFYSTDSRTALYNAALQTAQPPVFQTPTPGAKAMQSALSYQVAANSPSGMLPNPAVVHNFWDAMMTYEFGSGVGTIVPSGQGNTPYGAGSAVAGPDTFYQLDYTGAVGPWQRVAYPGSMIGQGLPPTNSGVANGTPSGVPEINGVPTNAGWNLSLSNPLPLNTNAVRFSFGKLQVGQFNYVRIKLRLLTDPVSSGLQNNSEVMGGDSADLDATGTVFSSGGKDSLWIYAEGSVADNNSGFYVLKEITAVNGVPSNGQNVSPNDVIKYRITYINTGVQPVYAMFEDFLLTGLTYQAGTAVTLSGQNVFPVAPTFTASGTAPLNGTSAVFPATPILIPMGGGGSFQLEAKVAAAPPNPFVHNTIYVRYGTAAAALTNTVQSIAVSNVPNGGDFPPPNIAQSKTASPNSISPGSSTVYVITMINNGTTVGGAAPTQAASPSSTITDTLPIGFSYVTGSGTFYNNSNPVSVPAPAIGTNANGQQVATWTIPAGIRIASGGGVWKVTFRANTPANQAPGTYYNDVTSHIFYLIRTNRQSYVDTGTAQTAPVTVSNARLIKSTTTPTVYMTPNGATARYSITLYNDNPSALSNINITDTLPSGFSYKTGTASLSVNGGAVSAIPSGNITTSASTVSFNMGTLVANSYMSIDFDVNIATSANMGINNNTASATANIGGTPVTIPLYTGAPIVIQPQGLMVNKFVSDATGTALPAGQNGLIFNPSTAPAINTASAAVYYTIELINSGNAFAPNVGVSDVLPAGFVYNALNNASISYKRSVNNVVTTILAPASTPVNDAAKNYTVMPKWSVFDVPPQQNGVSSKILITFPVDIRMQAPVATNSPDVVKYTGVYQNTVSADGANNTFSGAPIDIFYPVAPKISVTKVVARGGQATYTVSILNNTSNSYTVNISDAISNRPGGATQLWPFVSDDLGTLTGGATRPAVGTTALNWTNIPVPVGGLAFSFTVTVPVAQAVAIYDNRISITIPPAATTYIWDGRAAANTVDNVSVALSVPTPPTLMKNTLNATSVAGPFNIASSAAPVYPNTGGTIWYELVVQNNSSSTPTFQLGSIIDTLPTGFTITDTGATGTRDTTAANYVVITRPKNSISGTTAGANVTNVAHANITLTGQNATFPTFSIPASSPAVPQGFELAIIFRATVGTAVAPATPGQYSNTFTVNDPNTANPPLGSYSGAIVDVAPVTISKTILPASSSIAAGQSTQYTIEVLNTNTTPVTFTAAKPLSVTDVLPYKTIAGAIPAASPVAYASTTSVYTIDPLLAGSTVVLPTTSPVTTLGTNAVWTFQNLTIPAASNGAAGKLVITFIASATAAAPDGVYPNTVNISFLDPVQNYTTAALTETATFSGANLTIATLTVTKTASVSFVPQTTMGASTSYQIRIQNPGASAQTVNVIENLPFGFVYNPVVAEASKSTATAVFVNRATQASGTVSNAFISSPSASNTALTAATSQFGIASISATGFVIPANTDLYINLNNVYIQPSVTQGTYYNSLSLKNNAGQVITSLNNTAPVTVGAPQLLINKTTTTPVIPNNTVNPGPSTATVHYDITVTNIGNASATGVVLMDLLPRLNPTASPTALYPTVIPANTVITITNGGVTTTLPAANYIVTQPAASDAVSFNSNPAGGFTIPAVVGGNNGILTIGFDVNIPTGSDVGMYYNTVNASTSNAGALTYASGSPFSITAFGIVKTVVAINGNTANKTSINPGDTVEYQIIGFNTGPNNMPNVNITDVLPGGFTYVLGSASITHTPVPPAAPITNPANPVGTTTLVWSPISTASNSAIIINFYALISASITPGTYYNNATINDGGSQTVATGNTAGVTMVMNPNMTILKSVTNLTTGGSGTTASPGDTLKYTMTVILNNNVTAQNIYVTDNLDNALDYIQGSEVFEPLTSGLTLAVINYYGRPPGYVFISSTATVPASTTVNTNIGRVIYNLSGQMVSQSQQFRINFNSKIQ